MAQRRYKPTSAGTRQRSVSDFKEITADRPHKKLTKGRIKRAGRNNQGRITVRYQGGGHKRAYRMIDFRRDKFDVPGTIKTIEYDPFRKARIALVCYADGEYRYILAPEGLTVGAVIVSGSADVEIKAGNCLPLGFIPVGTNIHNVELKPGAGGQMARGAGNFAQLVAKETDYAQVRLPSGEVRMVHIRCRASIGQLSNMEHSNLLIGKAGRNRWLGRMPGVRGVAQNPVDHPMGGGEGKSSGGRHPTTPWGKKTKGLKTRKRKKNSNKFILKRRKAVATTNAAASAT